MTASGEFQHKWVGAEGGQDGGFKFLFKERCRDALPKPSYGQFRSLNWLR